MMVAFTKLSIFLFFLACPVTVHGVIVYIHRITNSSVDISCETRNEETKAFAFTLKRRLRQVAYLLKGFPASINKSDDEDRITVLDDLENHKVQVKITNLQERDTDLFHCEFYYGELPNERTVPGMMEFFIHVEDLDDSCCCSTCLPLLYVVSGAAGLLAVIAIALTTISCRKRPGSGKPQNVVPVYEAMDRVWAAEGSSETQQVEKQAEANSSTFSCRDPHYHNAVSVKNAEVSL